MNQYTLKITFDQQFTLHILSAGPMLKGTGDKK